MQTGKSPGFRKAKWKLSMRWINSFLTLPLSFSLSLSLSLPAGSLALQGSTSATIILPSVTIGPALPWPSQKSLQGPSTPWALQHSQPRRGTLHLGHGSCVTGGGGGVGREGWMDG